MSNGAVNILNNAYFGSTLLTAYFNFKSPTGAELANQKIIATSDKFALNSQVAMMFYDDDSTVKSTYQKFYMLGTPGSVSYTHLDVYKRQDIRRGQGQD